MLFNQSKLKVMKICVTCVFCCLLPGPVVVKVVGDFSGLEINACLCF